MEVDSNEVERSDLDADTEVEDAMKNGLKRSSSAPLINQLVASEATSGLSREGPPRQRTHNYVPAAATSRWRRWSTSTSLSPVSPGSPISSQGAGWARLNRLRSEETGDVGIREIQTESHVQRGLCIENSLSQSWEDLSLSDNKEASKPAASSSSAAGQTSHSSRGRSGGSDPMTPLTIGVGPFPSPRTSPSPSPSPTRSSGSVSSNKQCFSPSMQMPVPNLSFSPSPSSSPTRRGWASRRSLSPITLRPSPLGPVKRKCMLDAESDSGATPSKRHSSLLSITHQNNSYRSAPYRLPGHLGSSWVTPVSSPCHSAGPASDSGSRESSPSPAPVFPASPATPGSLYPASPSQMDTSSSQPPTETSL